MPCLSSSVQSQTPTCLHSNGYIPHFRLTSVIGYRSATGPIRGALPETWRAVNGRPLFFVALLMEGNASRFGEIYQHLIDIAIRIPSFTFGFICYELPSRFRMPFPVVAVQQERCTGEARCNKKNTLRAQLFGDSIMWCCRQLWTTGDRMT